MPVILWFQLFTVNHKVAHHQSQSPPFPRIKILQLSAGIIMLMVAELSFWSCPLFDYEQKPSIIIINHHHAEPKSGM